MEHITEFFFTLYERRLSVMDRISREEGRIVRTLRIIDCAGTGFWQMNRDWKRFESSLTGPVLYGTSIESIHLMFTINMPNILYKLFDTIKAYIPPRLLGRTRLLG